MVYWNHGYKTIRQSCRNLFYTQWKKIIVPLKFIKTLKKKKLQIYDIDGELDELDYIVHKYNETHKTMKMKPIDVKSWIFWCKFSFSFS